MKQIMTFKCEYGNGTSIEYVTTKLSLPEILEDFRDFLQGAGFHVPGPLDIADDES